MFRPALLKADLFCCGLPSELLSFLADPQNMKAISLLIEINDPKTKGLAVRLVQDVADYASGNVLEPDERSRNAAETHRAQ